MVKRISRAGGLAVLVTAAVFLLMSATAGAQDDEPMDHSQFPQLAGPFESGPEVTAACLQCHRDVGEDVMGTVHWTWVYESDVTGETYGKRNVINNYCVSVAPNEPRCTSCHIGYGWSNDEFDFTDAGNIDCVVCHDTTGTYEKFPTGAGHPVYGEPVAFGGREWAAPDLALVAQSVGTPGRENCGSCHFTGGGGDAVKHGDIDTSLADPAFELDVHMSAEGADLACQDCHTTTDHQIAGGRYVMDSATGGPTRCSTCHGETPHGNETIDAHAAVVACQTCHIPEYARAQPTKMTWDWSTAGTPTDEGTHPNIIKDEATGKDVYDSRKGSFTWEADVVPAYAWSNGVFDYALIEEGVDPEVGFIVNAALGDREDGKIWPFKVFTGTQPYDAATGLIAPLNLFPNPARGDEDPATAFWRNWDLALAVEGGFAAWGYEFSGEMGDIDSVMLWPITHMVAPADQALGCTDCHAAGGRLDWTALGYDADQAAGLATFPPSLSPEETTTTTAAATTTTTEAATTTTEATTTTGAAPTTTVVAMPDDEDGSSVVPIVMVVIGLVLLAGAGGYAFGTRERR